MKRTFAVCGILLGVSVMIAGLWVWFQTRPLPRAVLEVEAHDVDVNVTGIGRWVLTYHAPNATVAWYHMLGDQLAAHGWAAHNQEGPDIYSAPHPPELPLRFERLVGAILWEELALEPEFHDPMQIRIHVRRAFHLDWGLWLHALGMDVDYSDMSRNQAAAAGQIPHRSVQGDRGKGSLPEKRRMLIASIRHSVL
jgi:hypothetical protein